MSKVTVVGAGNVGATCANVLAVNEVANEVCLIDIKEGFAEGKAMDIMQTAQLMGFDTVVEGVTNDLVSSLPMAGVKFLNASALDWLILI